jgi:2,5-dichlorohydroquinone reductive dechlorinase
MDNSLSLIVEEVRRTLMEEQLNRSHAAPPRFELFYHPNSICAQKVRAIFAHHKIPYCAQFVNIATGETYLPSYVRLRLIGCRSIAGPLARTHSGSTSVNSSGCDPAVVPTLVDWETNSVIVDSRRICMHLDQSQGQQRTLRPAAWASKIDEELEIVDNFPNYQLRLGNPPAGGETPVMIKGSGGTGFGLTKVERCRRYIEENSADPDLVEAYQAKLDKELQATSELLTPSAMKAVYETVRLSLETLERKLANGNAVWLVGDTVTMADIFWAVQLLRVENLCQDLFWGEDRLPNVRSYLQGLRSLPAIQASVRIGPDGVA